jgi:hypothetical protein
LNGFLLRHGSSPFSMCPPKRRPRYQVDANTEVIVDALANFSGGKQLLNGQPVRLNHSNLIIRLAHHVPSTQQMGDSTLFMAATALRSYRQ